MIISHSVIPSGGWIYTTEKGIRLVAETFDLLVSNVKTHRMYNGIPMGDVAGDIERQLAHLHPHLKKENVLA